MARVERVYGVALTTESKTNRSRLSNGEINPAVGGEFLAINAVMSALADELDLLANEVESHAQ